MERYVNNDGTIAKYVHDDGSETSIKTWPKGMETCGSGRNKFNVFASCSSGCPIKCGFCFLTAKKFPYKKLNAAQITENVVKAVTMELLDFRPELRKIPMNLSWMGMGDPFLDLEVVSYATGHIFDEVSGYIQEIEGVDIATSLPRISYDDKKHLDYIDIFLNNTKKLTNKPLGRTDARLFYSLHTIREEVRRKMIPHSIPIGIALDYLYDNFEYNIIYHAIFLEGINDKIQDIEFLRDYFKYNNDQLRILRYNKCVNSIYNESEKFNEIIKYLNMSEINMKVQISPGSEISAACGMFLMK